MIDVSDGLVADCASSRTRRACASRSMTCRWPTEPRSTTRCTAARTSCSSSACGPVRAEGWRTSDVRLPVRASRTRRWLRDLRGGSTLLEAAGRPHDRRSRLVWWSGCRRGPRDVRVAGRMGNLRDHSRYRAEQRRRGRRRDAVGRHRGRADQCGVRRHARRRDQDRHARLARDGRHGRGRAALRHPARGRPGDRRRRRARSCSHVATAAANPPKHGSAVGAATVNPTHPRRWRSPASLSKDEDSMVQAARAMLEYGCHAAMVKGGHVGPGGARLRARPVRPVRIWARVAAS